jgi:ethanolamine utilization protein EutQ (cupin superfamily)
LGTDGIDWIPVAGEIFVSDLVDQAGEPDAKMTVGYARLGAGDEMEISFPYDEVLVITRGSYTVTTADGEELSAGPGEVIYLPGGSTNRSRADEETEMVYVANPPDVYAAHVAAAGG